MAEQRQKGKSPALMVIPGLVMVLLFCGFVFFLVSQGQSIPKVEEVKAQGRLKNLADLNSENQKVLTQYRWVDKSKGVVGVPIDRAMELVVADFQLNKPHPSGPVALPAAPTPAPNSQKPAGQP